MRSMREKYKRVELWYWNNSIRSRLIVTYIDKYDNLWYGEWTRNMIIKMECYMRLKYENMILDRNMRIWYETECMRSKYENTIWNWMWM